MPGRKLQMLLSPCSRPETFFKLIKTKRQLTIDEGKEKLTSSIQQKLHNLEVFPSRRQLGLFSTLWQIQRLNQGCNLTYIVLHGPLIAEWTAENY